jgi:hypothetical protein
MYASVLLLLRELVIVMSGLGPGTVFQAIWPPCLLLRVKPPKPRESRHTRL